MIRPRPEPEQEAERAVERADPAVETMSEMRTVMIETIRRVTRNTPPITAPVATMSLEMLALAIGRSRG